MSRVESINAEISFLRDNDDSLVSDGYHTFGELYEHRVALYIALCRAREWRDVWKAHHYDGWFALGIFSEPGRQITYHVPERYWNDCQCETLERPVEFDGHSPADVLERLKHL